MGEGVWVWRVKDPVTQEPGKSSLCCWSWFHGNEGGSGLRDSFCRWVEQNQRFTRVDRVMADGVSLRQQAVQGTGAGSWYNVRILVDLTTPHLWCRWGSLWNFPQEVHMGRPFPFEIDSRTNGFWIQVHGKGSSQDGFLYLWLGQAPLIPWLCL